MKQEDTVESDGSESDSRYALLGRMRAGVEVQPRSYYKARGWAQRYSLASDPSREGRRCSTVACSEDRERVSPPNFTIWARVLTRSMIEAVRKSCPKGKSWCTAGGDGSSVRVCAHDKWMSLVGRQLIAGVVVAESAGVREFE